MSQALKLRAASEIADNYIEIILSEHPGLLVQEIADEGSKDIAKSAKALAEFRLQLTKAIAEQPLPNYESDAEEAGDSDTGSKDSDD